MASDSSEEEFERLKEAVDENFLTKDLYESDKSKNKTRSSPEPVCSSRFQKHDVELSNPLSLKVTPEFQKHVSKHLSRILDEMIGYTEIIVKKRNIETKYSESGVRLLSSSKNYLVSSKNCHQIEKQKKFVKKTLSESDYKKRAKEVAVTGEWVLSQEDTKYWAPNTKGEVEILRIDNNCIKENFKKKKQKD